MDTWHIPWRLLEFKHWCLLPQSWKEPQPNSAFPSTPQPPPRDNPTPSPGLSPPRTHRPLPVSPLTGQLCWGSRALPAGKRNPFPPHSLHRRLRHLLVSHPSISRGWSQRSRAEFWGQGRACPAAAVGQLCLVPLVLFPLGIGCVAGTPAHLVLLSQGELETLRGKSTYPAGLFKHPHYQIHGCCLQSVLQGPGIPGTLRFLGDLGDSLAETRGNCTGF